MSSVINDNSHYIEFTVSSDEEFVKTSNKLIAKYPPRHWDLTRYRSTNATCIDFSTPVTIIYYRINSGYINMFYRPDNIRDFRRKYEASSEYAIYTPNKILKYNKDKL